MSEDADALRLELEQKPSEELISILRNRDEEEWRPEAFDVVAAVLRARGVSPEEVMAMGPEGYYAVESAPTVTIGRFFSPAEAHGLRMALEEAGIPAWVADEAGGTSFGFGVGSRLQVRATDEEAARQVLASAPLAGEALPAETAASPCPACGSRNAAPEEREGTWYSVCAECEEAWPLV